ncbi:dihydroxyacetone kinase subunit DhaK [Paenibacillus thiaminolyticus]|uniref:dihydroxyacetone kinase subunit DhaK n=1 Tax=Paenibacillus thiaminolyticus TaxID=49283 RepID=UPI003C12FF6A
MISGGGSGHEPAHAGFVGQGCSMWRCAAMCSPPVPDSGLSSDQGFRQQKGTLLIIKIIAATL